MTDAIITVGLSKTFGGGRALFGRHNPSVTAVSDVDFHVSKGETIALVGESGCGKSTLARMLVGLERPSHGTVRIEGQDVTQQTSRTLKALGRMIQYVFQSPSASLNPRRTVRESISAPMHRLLRLGHAEQEQQTVELMHRVGLDLALLDRYPHELSGGQAQRVAIARALAANAGIVVLDEPVSSLDVSIQAQVLKLLNQLKRDLSLTYVFISHDLAVVEAIADRVAVMYAGRIVELGTARDVFGSPRHPYTALLLASAPRPGFGLATSPKGPEDRGTESDNLDICAGCAFAPRCAWADDVCRTRQPLLAKSDGRSSACWHPLSHGSEPASTNLKPLQN